MRSGISKNKKPTPHAAPRLDRGIKEIQGVSDFLRRLSAARGAEVTTRRNVCESFSLKKKMWRRERDSNPRYRFEGGTRDFQSRSFGQLGHLSAVSLTRNTVSLRLLANSRKVYMLFPSASLESALSFLQKAISPRPRVKFSSA
jgi:hypothetical protein